MQGMGKMQYIQRAGHPCELSNVTQEFPGYRPNLLVSSMGCQISQKSESTLSTCFHTYFGQCLGNVGGYFSG